MAARRERWLGRPSLNAIRVIIGSFLCAVALGVPSGFEPFVLFDLVLPADMVEAAGLLTWLILSVTFVCGIALRVITLFLVILLLASTIATYLQSAADLGAVWQSVAFAVSLLLCYASLRPYEMHKAALFPTLALRGSAARAMQKDVVPRRVTRVRRASDQGDERDSLRHMRPVIAPTEQMMGMADRTPQASRPTSFVQDDWPEDDVVNIFAHD